jgi:hypothetical protein
VHAAAEVERALRAAERADHPLYCSEFGVLATVPDETRARRYRDVLGVLEERGIAWANWDAKGGFWIWDSDEPTVVHRVLAERRR